LALLHPSSSYSYSSSEQNINQKLCSQFFIFTTGGHYCTANENYFFITFACLLRDYKCCKLYIYKAYFWLLQIKQSFRNIYIYTYSNCKFFIAAKAIVTGGWVVESIVLSFICQVAKVALSFIRTDKTLKKKTAGIIFKGCDFSEICEREHSERYSACISSFKEFFFFNLREKHTLEF